ncbi:hypothetical protein [Paenibacillus harenae]|uniref:Methyl-accepting chemotaxis protein n=1 Tax=Paenibacillus harenae TaxID=306543 RepID=A0ABT9TZ04_PAEHA|nr:hypothetical protein [Paenibacillus harenae]MDQ0112607.1 methyl-accepting chemotaxis protein [Paenibacillus harenae]
MFCCNHAVILKEIGASEQEADITSSAQQQSASIQEISAAIQQLSSLSVDLNESVKPFKL